MPAEHPVRRAVLASLAALGSGDVFIHVDPDVALERAVQRDVALFGSEDAVRRRYHDRYLPGQDLYLSSVHPDEMADILIDNNDVAAPVLLRIPQA